MENDEMTIKRMIAYSDRKIAVHIVKKNGNWLNGYIKSVDNDLMIIDEFKDGNVPVFFQEISYVEGYKGVKK